VTIKMKTVSFQVKSRSVTVSRPVSKCEELYPLASDLLQQEMRECGAAPLKLQLLGNGKCTL